jgi:LmbE family N-acetylglucosaminyl deacetylase
MKFAMKGAEIFVPDGTSEEQALARTTHLAIVAHPDDIEILGAWPILECYQRRDRYFTGVVLTDGRGSPRTGAYEQTSDEEMRQLRFEEQRKAARLGEYSAQVLLDYPSRVVQDGRVPAPSMDLVAILRSARPQVVFIHNLADKHDIHVAVALRVISAIRTLPESARPRKLYGGGGLAQPRLADGQGQGSAGRLKA